MSLTFVKAKPQSHSQIKVNTAVALPPPNLVSAPTDALVATGTQATPPAIDKLSAEVAHDCPEENASFALPSSPLISAAASQEVANKYEAPEASPTTEVKQKPPPTQPGIYDVETETIPKPMKELDNWIHWIEELNEKDKLTKVPYIAGAKYLAKVNNPSTWRTFEQADKYRNNERGLGFVLTASSNIFSLTWTMYGIQKLVRSLLGRHG